MLVSFTNRCIQAQESCARPRSRTTGLRGEIGETADDSCKPVRWTRSVGHVMSQSQSYEAPMGDESMRRPVVEGE